MELGCTALDCRWELLFHAKKFSSHRKVAIKEKILASTSPWGVSFLNREDFYVEVHSTT